MRNLYLIPLFSIVLTHPTAYAQNHYSIGAKVGFGFNVPSANAAYEINGHTSAVRTNAFYAGGILGQYLLRNLFGMETGLVVSYQTFAPKDLVPGTIRNFLGWDYTEGITDYQMPIQLLYKLRHPTNPYKHFIISGGASIDWLLPQYFQKERNSLIASNILAGVRMASKKGKWGRMELGMEYQYTFRGRFSYTRLTDNGPEIFKAKYCLLSLNLYYFFLNKKFK